MSRSTFTPESARNALRSLRPAAERMCGLYRELESRRPPRIAPEQPVERAYFTLVAGVHAALAEIRRGGVRVGDMRSGALDFPALRDGKRVFLSWRVGEPTLQFWREADSGAQRRKLDEDGPWLES